MILANAVKLIRNNKILHNEVEYWVDLGCGNGLFTKALASMLQPGGVITAIDKNIDSLKNLSGIYYDVTVETQQQDFTTIQFPAAPDGILMANSLHYIAD